MTHIDIEQAKIHFAELLDLVAAGHEIVIDKNEQPFAKLSPTASTRPKREFGSARGKIFIAPDFDEPLPEFQEYS